MIEGTDCGKRVRGPLIFQPASRMLRVQKLYIFANRWHTLRCAVVREEGDKDEEGLEPSASKNVHVFLYLTFMSL